MTLAQQQLAFAAELRADDAMQGEASPGMQIYRNAYRARLLSALEVSYERTRAWVGEEAFAAAACHYVISQPPRDWTLDSYGANFPAVLACLFTGDDEVAELAWLEWHLQQAFAAPDRAELNGAVLAQAGLDDADWEQLRLTMASGFAAREVRRDCTGLWQALRSGVSAGFVLEPADPGMLIVWRQGLTPHFRVLSAGEFAALDCLVRNEPFGAAATIAGEAGAAQLGQWFAQWLNEGLFSGFSLPRAPLARPPGAGC